MKTQNNNRRTIPDRRIDIKELRKSIKKLFIETELMQKDICSELGLHPTSLSNALNSRCSKGAVATLQTVKELLESRLKSDFVN